MAAGYHIGLTEKAVEAGEQVQRLDPVQALANNRAFRALVDAARSGKYGSSSSAKVIWGRTRTVMRTRLRADWQRWREQL